MPFFAACSIEFTAADYAQAVEFPMGVSVMIWLPWVWLPTAILVEFLVLILVRRVRIFAHGRSDTVKMKNIFLGGILLPGLIAFAGKLSRKPAINLRQNQRSTSSYCSIVLRMPRNLGRKRWRSFRTSTWPISERWQPSISS